MRKKHSLLSLSLIPVVCLCSAAISLFGIGFCAWYATDGAFAKIDPINLEVGDVEVFSGLHKYGFALVSNSMTSITYSKRVSADDETNIKRVINDNHLTITATVDIKIMSEAGFDDGEYLTVSFAYTGYSSTTNNIVDTLTLYPENYTGYTFSAQKSSTNLQTKNGTTTEFFFPMKSKDNISLSTVALLDSTYPRTNTHTGITYEVPIVFSFEISENTLNTDILDSNTKYSVTFGLSTSAA